MRNKISFVLLTYEFTDVCLIKHINLLVSLLVKQKASD